MGAKHSAHQAAAAAASMARSDIALQDSLLKTGIEANDVGQKDAGRPGSAVEHSDGEERETWGKKADFLLSVIGFAVDLANVWRFPYLCYKNGGGAFLICYGMMLVLGGIPLFYMELALGQYHRKGAITCWGRVCPLFKGVGCSVVLIAFYTDFFYNVIIAWALYYFIASFGSTLPWTTCNNTWNTPACCDNYDMKINSSFLSCAMNGSGQDSQELLANGSLLANTSATNVTLTPRSAAMEYFERGMLELHKSDGIDSIGTVRWPIALCLLAVYLICYFSLWKGISTSGKVVWFTALFPYIVLLILLVRGVTLDGASDGIKYYLTPDFARLSSSEVWIDAATQVFFSLGPGFGVLLAYASYNKFHNNVYRDALITSSINCMTSFLSGFVIFSVLGYMAQRSGQDIDKVATEGPGLVFVVYPEAIATLPGSTFWSLIFFMMLLTLGLDSSFGGSEAVLTAISDEFPILKKYRELTVGVLFTFYFIVGLGSCTQGGAYVVHLMDKYAVGYPILVAVFLETIAVSWLYGVDRFAQDIKDMLGFKPGLYWRICWKYVSPIFILGIMMFAFVTHVPIKYDDYIYPAWANIVGWCLALSSMLCMPVFAVVSVFRAKGSFLERMRTLTTPWQDNRKSNVTAIYAKSNGSSLADPV